MGQGFISFSLCRTTSSSNIHVTHPFAPLLRHSLVLHRLYIFSSSIPPFTLATPLLLATPPSVLCRSHPPFFALNTTHSACPPTRHPQRRTTSTLLLSRFVTRIPAYSSTPPLLSYIFSSDCLPQASVVGFLACSPFEPSFHYPSSDRQGSCSSTTITGQNARLQRRRSLRLAVDGQECRVLHLIVRKHALAASITHTFILFVR